MESIHFFDWTCLPHLSRLRCTPIKGIQAVKDQPERTPTRSLPLILESLFMSDEVFEQ
jgi:hypothetical protein